MTIDLSVFKNIDFNSPENLIFLAIVFVLVLIIFIIFIFIASKILKFIKRLLAGIFNTGKKPKFNQKEVVARKQNGSEIVNAPRQRIMGGDFIKGAEVEKKQEIEKTYKDNYKAKEQKDIVEGLSKLKSEGQDGEETLESKMPSRGDKKEEQDSHAEIKIPTSKHFSKEQRAQQNILANGAQGDNTSQGKEFFGEIKRKIEQSVSVPGTAASLQIQKEPSPAGAIKIKGGISQEKVNKGEVETVKRIAVEKNKEIIEKTPGLKEKIEMATSVREVASILGARPEFMQKGSSLVTRGNSVNNVQQDDSIFAGKSEISRMKLEGEMKSSPKVWQASRQEGLNMSPVERAKLVKEVFSSALGGNISKTDLKLGISKLNQKLLGAKDVSQHAKIRKEIKFFKKIGGIK
jgi:hypothetical protein